MSRYSPLWGEMPTLVLGEIYNNLDAVDRMNASQTCRHWRGVLFQKRFFKHLKHRLNIDNDRQCTFFRQILCYLTTEVTIVFDFHNVFHMEKIRRILYRISRCENIHGLRFETNSVGVAAPANLTDDSLVNIERCFIMPLKVFLSRKQYACKVLDLGGIESLTYYGHDIIKALAKPQDLEQITLASLKYDPSNYPIFSLDSIFLQKCSLLQVLSIDYDSLNEEILRAIQILPLKKFLICVHGLDRQHPGISETAWAEFTAHFTGIDLILSLVYAYEAVEVLQVRVLRRNMPITHLRVLFCDYMNVEALDWMSLNNNSTIRSVQWIDSAYKHSEKNVMELFLRSGQDPFVMMSWRCKNLEEIVIHGYVLDPHNIVGISRLRGSTLKRFEVSMIDRLPNEPDVHTFIEEINVLLGQKWKPLTTENLHPALGYMPVSDEMRDEYVFKLLRSDISK